MCVVKTRQTKDGRCWIFQQTYTNLLGEKKRYSSPKYKTKKEAVEKERLYLLSLNNEKVNCNNMTFLDLYNKYIETQKNNVKLTTMSSYIKRWEYIKILSNVKLSSFDTAHYEMWRKKILEYPLSNRTRNYIYKFLKTIMNFGTKWYGLNFNQIYPKMTNFTNPNEIKKEMEFWTYEEFSKFISVEEDLTFKCLFKTLYFCGLRKGEARALNWNDIDFTNGTIRINKGLSDNVNGKKYIITSPKTLTSNRTLPIPKELLNDLKELKEKVMEFTNYNDNWFVFGNAVPLGDDIIRRRKNNNCKEANVKEIRIHDFRHSCASLLINNGADITLVAKFLGHSKIDETLNTYSHMFKNKLNNIIGLIDNLNENAKSDIDIDSTKNNDDYEISL